MGYFGLGKIDFRLPEQVLLNNIQSEYFFKAKRNYKIEGNKVKFDEINLDQTTVLKLPAVIHFNLMDLDPVYRKLGIITDLCPKFKSHKDLTMVQTRPGEAQKNLLLKFASEKNSAISKANAVCHKLDCHLEATIQDQKNVVDKAKRFKRIRSKFKRYLFHLASLGLSPQILMSHNMPP